MAYYKITLTNGGDLVLLSDGVVNTDYSISLIGKNVSNFGDLQNENFVHMLENFSNSVQPKSPLKGQLWFKSSPEVARPLVFDGLSWKPLATCLYHSTTTDVLSNAGGYNLAANRPGDFWFDSVRKQLHVVTSGTTTSTQTVMIGPESVDGFSTTRFVSTRMFDPSGISYPVIQAVLDGEVIAVMSKSSFTQTASTATVVNGFPKVNRGITFKNYNASTRYSTATSDVLLYGMHEQLDTSYPRRNVNEHIQSSWFVDNNYKLNLGTTSQGNISWDQGTNSVLVESTGVIKLQTTATSIVFNGTELSASAVGVNLGSNSNPYQTVFLTKLSAPSVSTTAILEGNWNLSVGTKLIPTTDLSNDLGSLTNRFDTVYAKNVNGGNGTSNLVGSWILTTSTTLTPEADLVSVLGASNKRFDTVYTKNISVSTNSETISIVGNIQVDGNVVPKVTDTFNSGSTSSRWNNVFAKNIVVDSEVVDTLSVNQVTANSLVTPAASITTATISKIIDGFANAITKFDADVTLAANAHGFISTQRAVKTYVDTTKDYIIGLINALSADVNTRISNIRTVPAGAVFYVAMLNVPTGYLMCNGAGHSTTSYPELFAEIGYTYGGSGGTFHVPDLRGQFIRGWDAGRGLDAGRGFGSAQADDYKTHKHGITLSHEQGGSHDQNGFPQTDWTGGMVFHSPDQPDGSWCYPNGAGNPMSSTGGSETRPKNVALLPIIKI